jgi:hypothetical protein
LTDIKRQFFKNTQHGAAFVQQLVGIIFKSSTGRIVAGIYVMQFAGFAVVNSKETGNKFLRDCIPVNQVVEFRNYGFQVGSGAKWYANQPEN